MVVFSKNFSFRGKGDFYRLGHGTDNHVREPKLIEGLRGKHIVDIAVGALHCLAVSQDGEVHKIIVKYILSDNKISSL